MRPNTSPMPNTLKKNQAAAERIDSAITNTRFEKSITLSTITGAELIQE